MILKNKVAIVTGAKQGIGDNGHFVFQYHNLISFY